MFVLEHIKRMHHLDQAGFNVSAAMTCVLPTAQTVYTGDEDGRVVSAGGSSVVEVLTTNDDFFSMSGIAFNGMTDVDETVLGVIKE